MINLHSEEKGSSVLDIGPSNEGAKYCVGTLSSLLFGDRRPIRRQQGAVMIYISWFGCTLCWDYHANRLRGQPTFSGMTARLKEMEWSDSQCVICKPCPHYSNRPSQVLRFRPIAFSPLWIISVLKSAYLRLHYSLGAVLLFPKNLLSCARSRDPMSSRAAPQNVTLRQPVQQHLMPL